MEIKNFDQMMEVRGRIEKLTAFRADLDDIETRIMLAVRTEHPVGIQLNRSLRSVESKVRDLQSTVGNKLEELRFALAQWEAGIKDITTPEIHRQQTLAESFGFDLPAYEEEQR